MSRPGVFAWDRVDPASELLAAELPSTLRGRAADLGGGFGYLSSELLERCPAITSLHVYEAEARALELAQLNLSRHAARAAIDYRWHDVTTGLTDSYDTIVMNPPFHTGSGAENPGLGRRFIAVAAEALAAGGRLWLVANRHLPYENVLNANFGTVRIVTQRYGFKIVEALRGAGR
jgi:16S rRNA (guanine1207-N2)-methyltransferase